MTDCHCSACSSVYPGLWGIKVLRGFLHVFSCGVVLLSASVQAHEWVYVVRSGDTLYELAANYLQRQEDWVRLQAHNAVEDPLRLKPGTPLSVPVALLKRGAAVAEVVHVRGRVEVVSGGDRLLVASGARLPAGTTLVTGADSNASLRFVDGSRLLVTSSSELTLAQMRQYGRTGMAETTIRLHQGELESRVVPQKGPLSNYRIESPVLNLGVRGTDFRMTLTEAGLGMGEVLSGRVLADSGRVRRLLAAGFGAAVESGGQLGVPVALAPPPDLSGLPLRFEYLPLRIEWPAVEGVSQWRAQVVSVADDTVMLLDGTVEESAVRWGDLPDGRYRLRVRAISPGGLEGMDAEHLFELAARPEAPFILTPRADETLGGERVAFRWTVPLGGMQYRLQVSTQADFNPTVLDVVGAEDIGQRVPLPAGDYFWRLASITPEGRQGPFGVVQSFRLRPLPAAPALGAPVTGSEAVTLRWHASESDLDYRVQVARDESFQERVIDHDQTSAELELPRGEGGVFYIRVQVRTRDGITGSFSQPQRIEVPATRHWWPLMLLPLLLLL